MSRLWCLYEVFCSTLPASGVAYNNAGKSSGKCTFDIALHYNLLDDGANGTSSNIKSKKSPFALDLLGACKDVEHLCKWACALDLQHCTASDAADADRLLSIIHNNIGATDFIEAVRSVLHNWVQDTLNARTGDDRSQYSSSILGASSRDGNGGASALITSTSKLSLYKQHCLCRIYHIRGDTMRAEGAMIEIGKVCEVCIF